MNKIFRSFRQSFEALLNLKMLSLLLIPPFAAVLLLFIIFVVFWQGWVLGLGLWFQNSWMLGWATDFPQLGTWLAVGFLVLLFIPMAYLLAVVLTSIFAMPLVLSWVVKRDFPGLEKKKGGSTAGSVMNTLKASGLFVIYFLITLPLWLIPGGQVAIPIFLTAWLNKKVFVYDVLQDFATLEERNAIEKAESGTLYGMGVIMGFFAYIPLAFMFVPVISALCYTYFCLYELADRRRRL